MKEKKRKQRKERKGKKEKERKKFLFPHFGTILVPVTQINFF